MPLNMGCLLKCNLGAFRPHNGRLVVMMSGTRLGLRASLEIIMNARGPASAIGPVVALYF
jgi:hypothetical protein